MCISPKSPGEADAAGAGTTLQEPLPGKCPFLLHLLHSFFPHRKKKLFLLDIFCQL